MLGKRIRQWSSFIKKMAENLAKDISMAERVQYNASNDIYNIEHEAKLRQKVDLESSIESLEKQMRREIAQVLKRSESKVIYLLSKANEKYKQHTRSSLKKQEVKQYNALIKVCEKSRWEYMVHRQSCGFTIRNYEIVTSLYKLPPLIPVSQQQQSKEFKN